MILIQPDLETKKPYHEKMIQREMNDYAKTLGYGTTFQFLVDDATGSSKRSLREGSRLTSPQGSPSSRVVAGRARPRQPSATVTLTVC